MINYTELSARISRETLAIQRSIGEKAGNITMSLAMGVSGLVVGFTRGWALSLTLLAIAPVLVVVTLIYSKALTGGLSKSLMAYS